MIKVFLLKIKKKLHFPSIENPTEEKSDSSLNYNTFIYSLNVKNGVDFFILELIKKLYIF